MAAMITLLIASGCESGQSAQPPASSATEEQEAPQFTVPFQKEGTLDFVRGEESYLTIDIEIADNDSTIERGLMQRTSMPDMGGMIFLMPEEELQNFWMSNTQISLDILFANSAGEIVNIEKYTTPLSPESVPSRFPAIYVVEVAAGFTDTHGIIEGDRIEWRRVE